MRNGIKFEQAIKEAEQILFFCEIIVTLSKINRDENFNKHTLVAHAELI